MIAQELSRELEPIGNPDRAFVQHLLLRLRGGADSRRDRHRPLRTQADHAGHGRSGCRRNGAFRSCTLRRVLVASRDGHGARLLRFLDGAPGDLCRCVSRPSAFASPHQPADGTGGISAPCGHGASCWPAARLFGWRASFMGVAILAGVVTLGLIWAVPKDAYPGRVRESWADTFRGVGAALKVRSFWPVFFVHLTAYSCFASVIGLWGGPWAGGRPSGRIPSTKGGILLVVRLGPDGRPVCSGAPWTASGAATRDLFFSGAGPWRFS